MIYIDYWLPYQLYSDTWIRLEQAASTVATVFALLQVDCALSPTLSSSTCYPSWQQLQLQSVLLFVSFFLPILVVYCIRYYYYLILFTFKVVTVDQLKPGTHGHNLVLKVVNSHVVEEKTRTDGSKIKIAECLVGDSTGCIILTARNGTSLSYCKFNCFFSEQIEKCQQGRTVTVRNSKIDMFKGFMRLAVDRWGKIEVNNEPAKFEVNTTNNLSQVEYELVTVNDE